MNLGGRCRRVLLAMSFSQCCIDMRKCRKTNLEDIGDGSSVLGRLALGGDDSNGRPRHRGRRGRAAVVSESRRSFRDAHMLESGCGLPRVYPSVTCKTTALAPPVHYTMLQ